MRKLQNKAAVWQGIARFLGSSKSEVRGVRATRSALRAFSLLTSYLLLVLAARAQTIELLPGAPSVYEAGGAAGTNVTIVITRSPATGASSVELTTMDATANAGADYLGTNVTVNFADGEVFQIVNIAVIDDLLIESAEQFLVFLSNPMGGSLGANTNQLVTIFDNDGQFRFIPTTNVVVDEDITNAVLEVERAGDLSGSASVDFFTVDGTAQSAGPAFADFTAVSGTLVFTNGQGTNLILVPIVDDCRVEATERFQVVLTNGVGGTVSALAGVSTVSINDNDTAAGSISIFSISLDAGPLFDPTAPLIYEHLTTRITVRVRRSQSCDTNNVPIPFAGQPTVEVVLQGGPDCPGTDLARFGVDYTSSTTSLQWTGNEQNGDVTFAINIVNDDFVELDEFFDIIIRNPQGTPRPSIGRGRFTVGIRSDDLPAGGVDPAFNLINVFNPTPGANNSVYAVAVVPGAPVNPNGDKVYVGGDFTAINAVVRNRIARVDTFGAVDTSFDPGSGADGFVEAIAIQSDGRVLIGGGFTSVDNFNRPGIARLNENGTLDATFDPGSGVNGVVHSIAVQPDGNIIIAGQFTSYNDVPVQNLARLFPNGTLDTSFAPGGGPDGTVWTVVARPSEIYVGGEFTTFDGLTRNRIARLGTNGLVDTNFVPLFGANDTVYSIVVAGSLPYVAGAFTSFDGLARYGIARLLNNGLLDTTFDPGAGVDGNIYNVSVQPSGQIIVAGDFDNYDGEPRASIARLNTDGTLDTSFLDIHYNQTQPGVNGFINSVSAQSTGRLIVGGSFTQVGGGWDLAGGSLTNAVTPKFNLARVMAHNNPEAFNMPGNVRFSSATYSVDENVLGGLITVTVERINGRYGPLTVSYHTEDGTAVGGVDYDSVTNTVSWLDCDQISRTFTIRIRDNDVIQGNRTFKLVLSDPVSIGGVAPADPALGGRRTAVVTVVDNDFARGVLGFSQPVFTVGEGDGTATVTVTRTNGSVGLVTVDYATYNQTALAGAGNDYTAKSGTLTFASGVTTQTVTVAINNDTATENEEWFGLRLTNVVGGARLGLSNAAVLILDNEASSHGSISFASGGFTVNESNGTATVTLRRTSGALGTITANVITFDFPPGAGNARSNVDYTAIATNVTFAAGVLTQAIIVPIVNDSFVEGNEQLGIAITSAAGGTIGFQSNAVLTIVDDDAYGVLSLSRPRYFVNERATNITIEVVRTMGEAEEVSVDLTTSDVTATDPSDYGGTNVTLVFPNGVRTASVTLPIVNDPDLEGNESFRVTLSNFQKAGIGSFSNVLVTIIDDEALDVPAGSIDTGFEAHPDGFVNALGLQADGQLIIGGDFRTVDGFGFNRIARLTQIGTVDPFFRLGDGANDKVQALVVQPDDKIVVGGRFTQINTTNRARIARLNADGSIDSSFNPGAGADNPVFALALTAEGKVVLGGSFTTVNSVNRPNVAVLNTNGSVDVNFNTGAGLNGTVYAVAVQPDGKILVGGDFTLVNNTNRTRIARLNPNGALDLSFNSPGPGAAVRAIVVQPDGAILIGGSFTNVGPFASSYAARLLSNGAFDGSFNVGSGADAPVLALALQPNGKVVAVGDFRTFNGVSRNRITRLNANGSIDPTINFGTGANSFIAAVALQSNEEINIGGGFTQFNGVSRDYVARLVGGENTGAGAIGFLTSTFYVDEGGTNALITVQRNGGTAGSVDVQFTTQDGIDFGPFVAAMAPDHYTATNGTLTFPHGETLKTFKVRIVNTIAVEGDKLLFLSLSGATGGAIVDPARADSALVIEEDDSILSFTSPSFSVNEGVASGHATVTVQRSGSTNTAVVATVATVQGGSATWDDDFVPKVQDLLVFNPGEVLKVFTVDILEDLLVEGPETIRIDLFNPSVINRPDASVSLGLSSTLLTIVDNDFLPGEFSFTIATNRVPEAAGSATITVVRTNGSSGLVSVSYTITGISATAGEDFLGETIGSLSFADGETTNQFTIPIVNDVFLEGDELLRITLSNPQGGAILGGLTTSDLIIVDDDSIGFATNVFTVNESDGIATITVRRTGNTNLAFTLDFTTTNGTAITPDDYAHTNGTLSFAAGEVSKTFQVRVFDDALVEPIETVILLLTNASANVDLSGVVSARLDIIDSTKTVFFATNTFRANEGATNGAVTVMRGGSLTGNITVTLRTRDGSANNGADYIGFTNLLSFTSNEVSKVVLVPLRDDAQPEPIESVILELTPPGTAYVDAPGTASLLIIDDDPGPGFPDNTFDPGAGASRFVRALALQPDLRLVVGGAFTNFANSNLNYLARLHTNGALDTNFVVPGSGPNALVSSIGVFPSGHVVIGGAFSNFNGTPFNRLLRLTSNGVPDVSFSQPLQFDAALNAVAAQTDGKTVVGGAFKTPVAAVARMRVNGSLDLQFDSSGGADAPVNALTLLANGKVLIGGAFTNVGGSTYPRVARLGSNGVVDSTFVPASVAGGSVFALAAAPDGKVVIGGNFRQVNGLFRSGVARLNEDGTLDPTFNPGTGVTGTVYTVAVLTNGSVFVGGDFTTVNGTTCRRYALLQPNGAVDPRFDASVGADNTVYASLVTPDNKIYIGGDFTTVGGLTRRGVARLNVGDLSPLVPLAVTNVRIVSNAVQITVSTLPGRTYVLEGSGDLLYWLDLSTNVATGLLLDFTDPNVSGNPQRFYRARLLGP